MMQGATAIIGVLVGFLVVGVVGVYIGDAMITAVSGGDGVPNETRDTFYTSEVTVVETFELGVTLCKIIVIVSVAGIVFEALQQTGLIPGFNQGKQGGI